MTPLLIKNEKIKAIAINSLDCFEILKTHNQSHLIDVRTQPEWEFVGVPDLSPINKKVIFVSWQLYPDMRINDNFVTEVIRSKTKKNDMFFLICRSGQRSLRAAKYLNKLGFNNCFNITDGFEGNKDLSYHRSTFNGWKFNKLPWRQ